MGMYRSAGPPLRGALADATSYAWGLSVNGLTMVIACLWFLVIARETNSRPVAASR